MATVFTIKKKKKILSHVKLGWLLISDNQTRIIWIIENRLLLIPARIMLIPAITIFTIFTTFTPDFWAITPTNPGHPSPQKTYGKWKREGCDTVWQILWGHVGVEKVLVILGKMCLKFDRIFLTKVEGTRSGTDGEPKSSRSSRFHPYLNTK
jgi:hypothetical protein